MEGTMTVDVAPEIVDRLMGFYCDRREQCLEVHAACERFKGRRACGSRPGVCGLRRRAQPQSRASELDAEQIRRATRATL
jgi:hypothetical protein